MKCNKGSVKAAILLLIAAATAVLITVKFFNLQRSSLEKMGSNAEEQLNR